MNKEIERILEQFDEMPRLINLFIINNFGSDRRYIQKNTLLKLAKFHVTTTDRWKEAEKKHNVSCLYALPKNVFDEIENQNKYLFIEVWNNVLQFLWIGRTQFVDKINECDKLYLMIRTHLIQDYGYFDSIDTNKLFRVNDE